MKSVWSDQCVLPKREALRKDITTDTVIIGGGMAGILTAYMLKQQGMEAVIVEANRIASGATKNTTAKITIQHDLIYDRLINQFGEEKAKLYAQANSAALQKYRDIIHHKNIDCDFEEKPSYVYSLEHTDFLRAEEIAANILGIKAQLTEKTTLPFSVRGAVKFNNQAQFNPLAFLNAIIPDLTIYENTMVTGVEENIVFTEKGNITANHIVVATHFPFINMPGYYFARMHQERSYVVALDHAAQLDGTYISADEDGYSFRNYQNLLLLGGAGHRTGKKGPNSSYEILRKSAEKWYPQAQEKYNWSAQDCMTLDGVPYIGNYSSSTPHMYVATGFNKWGMTGSMTAALLLSDLIAGIENEWETLFTPQRFAVTASVANLLKDGAQSIAGLTKQQLSVPKEQIEHLKNGQGAIVEYEGAKAGVYKNEQGEVFMVSTQCPHLGCQLEWNSDELSWDCPCHGSRFDYMGNLIDNPATKPLERY